MNQLFEILSNLEEGTFYSELDLAALLFNTDAVFVSIADQEKVYKTYGTKPAETLHMSDLKKASAKHSITLSLNENIPVGFVHFTAQEEIDLEKKQALTLLSNLIAKNIAHKIDLLEIKDQNLAALRKSFHDLKNPLTSISLHAELIKLASEGNKKTALMADKIHTITQKMVALMNEILDKRSAKK